MGHIAPLRNQFTSMKTFKQSYDYIYHEIGREFLKQKIFGEWLLWRPWQRGRFFGEVKGVTFISVWFYHKTVLGHILHVVLFCAKKVILIEVYQDFRVLCSLLMSTEISVNLPGSKRKTRSPLENTPKVCRRRVSSSSLPGISKIDFELPSMDLTSSNPCVTSESVNVPLANQPPTIEAQGKTYN